MTAAGDLSRPAERVVAAVPTPFDDDLALDRRAFAGLLGELEPEVDAVLVAGTTGAFLALTDEERLALVADALEVFGADRTIAHVGSATSTGVRRLLDGSRGLGAERLALLTPFYVPLDQAALLDWFAAAAEHAAGARLYAYLFAERTAVASEVGTVNEVLALDGFAGLKVSGAAAADVATWVSVARPGQAVWSGDDANLRGVLAHGGTGVVSGTSAAVPRLFGRLGEATAPDGADTDEALEDEVRAATAAIGATLPLLHEALARRTGRPWASRLPGPAVTPAQREALVSVLGGDRSAPPTGSTAGPPAPGRGPSA